jgi:hypothetical protein
VDDLKNEKAQLQTEIEALKNADSQATMVVTEEPSVETTASVEAVDER